MKNCAPYTSAEAVETFTRGFEPALSLQALELFLEELRHLKPFCEPGKRETA